MKMERRQFIATAGAVTAVTLAGCLGDDDDTGSPEAVTEAYYELLEDPDEDEAADLLHPDSPIEPEEAEEDEEFQLDSVDADAEVALEDIADSEELAEYEPEGEDFEGAEIQPGELSADAFDDVADDEEVTLVRADLDVELADDAGEEAQGIVEMFEEWPAYLLVATDGGDWLVLDDTTIHFGGGF